MRIIIWGIVSLVVLLVAGLLVLNDPGYALFVYDRWTMEMPLWVFVLSGLVFIMALKLIGYVFGLPFRLFRWVRARRENRGTRLFYKGIYQLCLGELKRARNAFQKSGRCMSDPVLPYLQAALTAQRQRDTVAAEAFLARAAKFHLQEDYLLEIARAETHIALNQWNDAKTVLQQCYVKNFKQPKIIFLLHQVYLAKKDWQALWQLWPRLQKSTFFSRAEKNQLEKDIFMGLFERAEHESIDRIWLIWNLMSRELKKDAMIFASFIRSLRAHQQADEAEMYLRKFLKKTWDSQLIYLYGLLQPTDQLKQLAFAEQWLVEYPKDSNLLLTLGRLSFRNKIYGKARSYLQEAVHQVPCRETFVLLAHLAETLKDHDAALNYYRQAVSKDH